MKNYFITINITQKYAHINHTNSRTEITEASKIHYLSSKDKNKTTKNSCKLAAKKASK
jgi:hypothetical protein